MKKLLRLNILKTSGAILFLLILLGNALKAAPAPPDREFYELRVYHFSNPGQEKRLDAYLEHALIPGLHRAGIKQAGVFKLWGNDTAASPKVYVLIPYASLGDMLKVEEKLQKDKSYWSAGDDYLNASYDNAPYNRIEKILLRAFVNAPKLKASGVSTPRAQRIYELRSYESATEKLYVNKVKMFNDGDEIGLFHRLGFNGIFYGEVISGSAMPNLMYLTSFDNRESRDQHWKNFSSDPQWKKVSAMPEYSHNVSKSTILFLFPTEYSDL